MYKSTLRLAAVLSVVWLAGAPPAAAATPSVSCSGCVVVVDGRKVWGRAASVPLPNASTTKMVTALVAARRVALAAPVRVSPYAASIGGGGLDLSSGDVFTARDLLLAMLLSSSNEAAMALAEHTAGSEDRFVAQMNRLADRLGAGASHFNNPHGFDSPGHAASPRDLARIGAALLEVPMLARMVARTSATLDGPRGPVYVENRNPLLETYRGAVGIKTGQTSAAGNVLVAAARRDGRLVIAVAMRSADAAADARALLDHGFAHLPPEPSPEPSPTPSPSPSPSPSAQPELVPSHWVVGALVFDPAGATGVVAGAPADGLGDATDVSFVPAREIPLPLEAGDPVGTLTIASEDGSVTNVPAVASRPVRLSDESWFARLLTGLLRLAARVAQGVTA